MRPDEFLSRATGETKWDMSISKLELGIIIAAMSEKKSAIQHQEENGGWLRLDDEMNSSSGYATSSFIDTFVTRKSNLFEVDHQRRMYRIADGQENCFDTLRFESDGSICEKGDL